jgi:hypothetical protein
MAQLSARGEEAEKEEGGTGGLEDRKEKREEVMAPTECVGHHELLRLANQGKHACLLRRAGLV